MKTDAYERAVPTDLPELDRLCEQIFFLRRFEEKIAALYPEQEMKTPVHLGIGQEAVSAGFLWNVKSEDVVYSNHRGHLHYLAKGGDPYALAAELYGRDAGCCKGRGGSMHLVDVSCGLPGSSAIVAGGVPIAVGAALGFKLRDLPFVSIVFFGDGAFDEGVVYESMSFAALKKLPVIFVVENNGYATASPQRARQPLDNIHRRGEIFGIPGYRVDGNDVVDVRKIADTCIAAAREKNGPSLVECRTYRWKGHVGIDEDTGYRSAGEIASEKERCPLKIMETRYGIRVREDRKQEIQLKIEDIFRYAKACPYPMEDSLLDNVLEKRN